MPVQPHPFRTRTGPFANQIHQGRHPLLTRTARPDSSHQLARIYIASEPVHQADLCALERSRVADALGVFFDFMRDQHGKSLTYQLTADNPTSLMRYFQPVW